MNLRIAVKLHVLLQTLTKALAKFQKDPGKTVGKVAFTRYPVSYALSPKVTKSEQQMNSNNI